MILTLAISVLTLSSLLCLIRAVIGPSAPDRVVSIDALVALTIAILVLFGLMFEAPILLDVALVYAFVAFLGGVAIAKYLEGKGLEE